MEGGASEGGAATWVRSVAEALGCYEAEAVRRSTAKVEQSRAATALPGRPRVKYNAGLAAQRIANWEEAERWLLAALAEACGMKL